MYRAHRLSWEFANGPIPQGLEVCHNCPGGDNPHCVRPDHLFLGTQAENTHDMVKKGGSSKGAGRPAAKLTDATVTLARTLYASGHRVTELARTFGVTHATMRLALCGKTWRHVPMPETDDNGAATP